MGKKFEPSGLSSVQKFCTHKVFQLFKVAQNLDREPLTLQVNPLFLESLDDCHELLVVDFINALHRPVLFGVKGHQMQNTVIIVLGENAG